MRIFGFEFLSRKNAKKILKAIDLLYRLGYKWDNKKDDWLLR